MPEVSVVMPVYGVERFVGAAVSSVLAQRFSDFELIIIDDCSPDASLDICKDFDDPRIRLVEHTENRGLAGARNTGIRHATGALIAFLDSDDLWEPDKLARHVEHLKAKPAVGVSFSRSAFIDETGQPMNTFQMPKLAGIDADHLLCRNPVGNGSAPVIRRAVFEQIAYEDERYGCTETFYFDEAFRQSEDIECWIRIAATTSWRFEGLSEPLTLYRLNSGGLSANIPGQLASWDAVMVRTREYAPELVARSGRLARAYQLRYLARQAIRLRDGRLAARLVFAALRECPSIVVREPGRTAVTVAAALTQSLLPRSLYAAFEPVAIAAVGLTQRVRMGWQ